jgi:SAM-dependent methyltransferase
LRAIRRPTLLDVGCGRGFFLKALTAIGLDCYGLERPEFQSESALPFQLFKGEWNDLPTPEAYFDAITFWHVLEHLEEPKAALDHALRYLKPGGYLVVAVPNYSSWQAQWFGRHWFHLDLPRHLYHFSQKWLTKELQPLGEIVTIETLPTAEQSLFGFVQSFQNKYLSWMLPPNKYYTLMKQRKGLADLGVFMFLSLISCILLPFALAEHILSGVFGQNSAIVITVQKRSNA